jgi:MFS family permease
MSADPTSGVASASTSPRDDADLRQQIRQLYAYLALRTLSISGDAAWLFGVAWTAGVVGGAGGLGSLLAVAALPRLLLMPVAGGLADRWGIRRTMIVSDFVAAAIALGTAIGWAVFGPHLGFLYAAVLAFSCIESFYVPSSAAFVRLVVDKELLPQATSLRQSATSVAGIAGTAAGGALVALGGFAVVAAVDGVTFVAIGAGLALVRLRTGLVEPGEDTTPTVSRIGAALRLFWTTPLLRYSLARAFVVNCVGIAFINVGLVLQAQDREWSAASFALVDITLSAGTIVGGITLARMTVPEPVGRVVSAAFVLLGLVTLAMAAAPPYIVLVILAFALGLALVPVAGLGDAVVLAHLPEDRLAATTAVMITITTAAVPIGTVATGWFAASAGVGPTNLVLASALVLTALFACCVAELRNARIE